MSSAPAATNPKRLVLKNTLISLGGQVLGTPISILVSAVTARYLGAADFGQMYLAATITSLGFLFVDFGQGAMLTGSVARDRSQAGMLLGTSLAWRLGAAVFVYAVLALGCFGLGYEREFQVVLALVVVQWLFQSIAGACQDCVRGFERTDVGAAGQVAQQLFVLALVVPALVLGGGLKEALVAQAAACGLLAAVLLRLLRPLGVGKLSVSGDALKSLLKGGAPFLVFAVVLALQPNVDAVFLSKLAPEEVVGWHAAARRLINALALPASFVIGALYPTLSRLHVEDRGEFAETVRGALRATVLLSVPIALCCGFYRDIGIMIFSKEGFGPAQDNLIVLAPYLFLVYLSMPLGISILAAGRQKIWAATQFLCVLVSTVLDPLLIPWFQRRFGNGGLGVCSAAVVSEVLMVGGGLVLCDKGILDAKLVLATLRPIGAGVAMAAVAYALTGISSFIAAPIALSAYVAALWALGGLGPQQIGFLREALSRKPKAAR